MQTVQDYKKLAKRKQLEQRVVDLNQARTKLVSDLQDLGMAWPADRVTSGGRVDPETLVQDQRLIKSLQEKTYQDLLRQQATDIITQAREGSRFVALESKLHREPAVLEKVNLAPLQGEQLAYQKKQLEIFDYLAKHFSQFGQVTQSENMPEAGERFFNVVIPAILECCQTVIESGRDLHRQISERSKALGKLRRREQHELEQIQSVVGKSLTERDLSDASFSRQNRDYREVLTQIRALQTLKTSLLNQGNNLLDVGLDELSQLESQLISVVGQNQTSRDILLEIRTENQIWRKADLQAHVVQLLKDFDERIAQLIAAEIGRRFGADDLDHAAQRAFGDMLGEILDYQDYLGQVMGDSLQIITGNLEDLRQARVKFGRLVLDFYAV